MDEPIYEITVSMNATQTRGFFQTIDNAVKNWPGGHPVEQEILTNLRDQAYRMVLEAQFEG